MKTMFPMYKVNKIIFSSTIKHELKKKIHRKEIIAFSTFQKRWFTVILLLEKKMGGGDFKIYSKCSLCKSQSLTQ